MRIVLFLLLLASTARAAETEPHYAWFFPPREGSRGINAAVNELLAAGVRDVNARGDAGDRSCQDVAVAATARLGPTAGWFFVGLTRSWAVDFSPASSSEYVERFGPLSIYRNAPLLPFGKVVPVDPAVRVGDIVFGTDKIAHFFTNGARYFVRFEAERGVVGEAAAELLAIADGIEEEEELLGRWASGIFSYADLEANFAGLGFYRSLCEGPSPGLRLTGGQWQINTFDIADHVTPCWDEAFEPSAFASLDEEPIIAALGDLCDRWRQPAVQRRRESYLRRSCSRSHTHLQTRIAEGSVPDPRPFDIARRCSPR